VPSRATLGLSFSSLRHLKIKLFKPENSEQTSFLSLAKIIWKTSFSNVNPPFETSEQLKDLSWFLFLQLK
jgi:hypothetical protein